MAYKISWVTNLDTNINKKKIVCNNSPISWHKFSFQNEKINAWIDKYLVKDEEEIELNK